MPSHGSICWFECATTNVAAAKTFYTSLFGWTAADMPMSADHPGVYTMISAGGSEIAGMRALEGPVFEGVPSHWVSHVCVDDADAALEKTLELGGTVIAGPFDTPGDSRMAFLADPTGAPIAVFQLGERGGMAAGASNLGWIELHTTDAAAAETFYTALFGWTAKEDAQSGYTEFQHEGTSIAGMLPIPEEQRQLVPPNWLPYAMVDDCDAAMGKAADLGAKTVVPATDVPDVGRFAVFSDPAGAHLAVIKLTGHAAP